MNKRTTPTSRDSDKFVLRMPDGMRETIAELARASGRSMNAEIIYRLQKTFDEEAAPTESAPHQYQRKKKYTIQSDMPDEAMQELMTRIQEVWDKYKASKDK